MFYIIKIIEHISRSKTKGLSARGYAKVIRQNTHKHTYSKQWFPRRVSWFPKAKTSGKVVTKKHVRLKVIHRRIPFRTLNINSPCGTEKKNIKKIFSHKTSLPPYI